MPKAEELVKPLVHGCFFCLPTSPDLNPIEMAFSKLKMLLREHTARTFDTITQTVGEICDLFSITKCRGNFKAARYDAGY